MDEPTIFLAEQCKQIQRKIAILELQTQIAIFSKKLDAYAESKTPSNVSNYGNYQGCNQGWNPYYSSHSFYSHPMGAPQERESSLEDTFNSFMEEARLWRESTDSHMPQVEGTFCQLGQQANQLTTTIENLHQDQFPNITEVEPMEQCHTVDLQSDMEYECSTSKGEEIVYVEFMAQQEEEENTFEMGTDKKEEVQVIEDAYICIGNEGHVPPIKYPMECHEQESLLFCNDSSDMKIIKDLSVLDFEHDIFMNGVKFNEFENKRVVIGGLGKKEVMASCRGMNDASPRLIWMVAWIFIVSL